MCSIEERLLTSPQIIMLPSYSTNVVESFIQFFYVGEALIPENNLSEFISLCKEFNCDEIPALQNILQMKNDESVKLECEEMTVVTEIVNIQQESEAAVESIFFQIQDQSDMPSTGMETSRNVKEEYLNEEYIDDETQYEYMEVEEKKISETIQYPKSQENRRISASKSKPQGITKQRKATMSSLPVKVLNLKQLREDQEKFKIRLQEAVNSVRNNLNSIAKAAAEYEVPTSAIKRNLKNYKSSW